MHGLSRTLCDVYIEHASVMCLSGHICFINLFNNKFSYSSEDCINANSNRSQNLRAEN